MNNDKQTANYGCGLSLAVAIVAILFTWIMNHA